MWLGTCLSAVCARAVPTRRGALVGGGVGRGNTRQQQRGIRLTELGPRLSLELLKIQKGMCDGDVLFHAYEHRTPEEVKALERARAAKDAERAARRRTQEANVRRKAEARETQRRADRVRVGLPPEGKPPADGDAATTTTTHRKRPRDDDGGDDVDEEEEDVGDAEDGADPTGDEDEGEEEEEEE
jgi:ribosome biogenesis protein SSF1/2